MTWFNYLEYLCFAIAAEFEFHNGSTRMATPYLLDYIKNTLKKKKCSLSKMALGCCNTKYSQAEQFSYVEREKHS